MRRIVSFNSILSFLLYICILFDFGFFYLIDIPILKSKTMMGIVCIFTFLILTIRKKGFIRLNYSNLICLFFLLIFLLCDFITFVRYRVDFSIVGVWVVLRSPLLLGIVLSEKIFYDNSIKQFLNMSSILSIVWMIVGILENAIFKISGRHILKGYLDSVYFMRGNYVRVGLEIICIICFIYCCAICIEKERNWFGLIYICMYIIYQFTIDGTRSLQMATMLILGGMIIFSNYDNAKKQKKKYLLLFLIVISIVVLISSGYISSYVQSFNISSSNAIAISTIRRLGEWKAYWNAFLENPLFGIGDLQLGFGYDHYLNCGYDNYYMEDVGIVGSLARFGISAGIMYLVLIVYEIKVLSRIPKATMEFNFMMGILIYTLFSMINLSLLDEQNRLILPILISVIGGIDVAHKSIGSTNEKDIFC